MSRCLRLAVFVLAIALVGCATKAPPIVGVPPTDLDEQLEALKAADDAAERVARAEWRAEHPDYEPDSVLRTLRRQNVLYLESVALMPLGQAFDIEWDQPDPVAQFMWAVDSSVRGPVPNIRSPSTNVYRMTVPLAKLTVGPHTLSVWACDDKAVCSATAGTLPVTITSTTLPPPLPPAVVNHRLVQP